MSLSFGAIAGLAAIGGGISATNSTGGNVMSYNIGKRDRRDASKVDFDLYRKQRMFDYQYDSTLGLDLARMYDDKDYELARRYAENSASWSVEGLRRAGLNPILAAGNGFNASTGFQGQGPTGGGGSVPHAAGNSFNSRLDVDPIGDAQRVSSIDVQSSTADKLKADTNVAQAQADSIKAQTLKTYVDAINEYRSSGGIMKAVPAAVSRLFGSGDKNLDWLVDKSGFSSDSIVGDTFRQSKAAINQGVDWLKKVFSPSRRDSPPTSAKDVKVWLSDLSTAKELSDAVSPSPVPIRRESYGRPADKYDLEYFRRIENGKKMKKMIDDKRNTSPSPKIHGWH